MTHIIGMQESFWRILSLPTRGLQVHSNTKAAPKQPSERVRDKREMCELVSQAPGDWKNAEGTEGSLVNKAFTAQRSPRDLCGSSTGSNRQVLTCQDHCQWQLIYIPPLRSEPGQRKSGCDLYLYLPLTGATGRWALPNANPRAPLKKQPSSVSALVFISGRGDGNCCSNLGHHVNCM